MKRKLITQPRVHDLTFVFVFLLLAAGCVTPPSGLQMVRGTEQEDIPVPKRFELRSSYSPDLRIEVEQGKFRSWSGEYVGAQQIGEMVPWYITEMQKHRWRLRRVEGSGMAPRKLYFDKGDEVSKVEIDREIDASRGAYSTIVRAEIHPRGPEDFTVDEHLLRKDESAVKPASFTTGDAVPLPTAGDDLEVEPVEANPKAPPAGARPAVAPHDGEETPARRPGRDRKDVEEIERLENAAK